MISEILFSADPADERRCTFFVGQPVVSGPARRFTSCEAAEGVAVAEAVMAVPGVAEVLLVEDEVTVVKDSPAPWSQLEERIRYAIQSALPSATTPAASGGGPLDDDAMYDLVADIFQREVNPAVARHGGRVELIDVQDATVVVRMQGGCQGCGMANVTLRQGIEGSLRRMIPGLQGIEDITDHSAGTNPYFSSQKS